MMVMDRLLVSGNLMVISSIWHHHLNQNRYISKRDNNMQKLKLACSPPSKFLTKRIRLINKRHKEDLQDNGRNTESGLKRRTKPTKKLCLNLARTIPRLLLQYRHAPSDRSETTLARSLGASSRTQAMQVTNFSLSWRDHVYTMANLYKPEDTNAMR